MTEWEGRLRELGIELPAQPERLGLYQPGVLVGGLLFLSGQTPQVGNETVVSGLVGRDVSIADAAQGARLAALNALAQARNILGNLDRVCRVVRVTGYVAAADSFAEHPAVIDGASALLVEVFGESGAHARSAIGVSSLPQGAAVELDLVLEVVSDPDTREDRHSP